VTIARVVGTVVKITALFVWRALKVGYKVLKIIGWHFKEFGKEFYLGILKPLYVNAKRFYLWFRKFYVKYVDRVLEWIERFNRFVRRIYTATIGPIIDLLSGIRRLIVVLHLQNTRVGQALDRYLLALQDRFIRPILAIFETLGRWGLLLNSIFTNDLLMQPERAFTQAVRDGKMLATVWWRAQTQGLRDLPSDVRDVLALHRTAEQVNADVDAFFRTEAGPLVARIDAFDRSLPPLA